MPDLDFHPLANLFPLIDGEEFDALVDDIKANGLREEVVVWQGKVLDGRNRYRACRAAEVEPRLAYYRPELHGDPIAYVVSKNLRRRHLNESQRAMVAAEIATMGVGRPLDNPANLPDLSQVTQPQAARMLSISQRAIRNARQLRAADAPELVEAVRSGKLAVSAALQASKLTRERQREVIARAVAGEVNAARTVIKQGTRQLREAELGARQAAGNLELPTRRYGVILADPEWKFDAWSDAGLDRAPLYPTSATEIIATRPVAGIAAADCVLFLWSIAPMQPQAFEVMARWGFEYKSQAVWIKDRIITGYWFRGQHEVLLVGTRGRVPAPAMGTQFPSVLHGPSGEHSDKPDIQYELIERYFPTLPKIELNARRARPGWDCWEFDAPADISPAAGVPSGAGETEAEGPPAPPPPPTPVDDRLDLPDILRRKPVAS